MYGMAILKHHIVCHECYVLGSCDVCVGRCMPVASVFKRKGCHLPRESCWGRCPPGLCSPYSSSSIPLSAHLRPAWHHTSRSLHPGPLWPGKTHPILHAILFHSAVQYGYQAHLHFPLLPLMWWRWAPKKTKSRNSQQKHFHICWSHLRELGDDS